MYTMPTYTTPTSITELFHLVTYVHTTVLNDSKSESNGLQSDSLVLQGCMFSTMHFNCKPHPFLIMTTAATYIKTVELV